MDVIHTADERPLVSVLIPTWNRAGSIGKAIESALNQTWKNVEIIVVDNDSSDNTIEVVQQYVDKDSRIQFFKNEKNIGPVNNWISCFERSKGEFVKILWSDDWMDYDVIEKLIQPLLSSRKYGFSMCKATLYSSKNEVIGEMYNLKKDKDIDSEVFICGMALRIPHLPYSPSTALIRREMLNFAITEKTLLPEECNLKAIGLDLLMQYYAIKNGLKGCYVSDVRVNLFASEDSITMTSDKAELNSCYEYAVINILKKEDLSVYIFLRLIRMLIGGAKYRLNDEVKGKYWKEMSLGRAFLRLPKIIKALIY